MKKAAMIIFLLFQGYVHADDNMPQSLINDATDFTVINSTFAFADVNPHSFYFYDDYGRDNNLILLIDADGDIFLRGKWIGWDKRLSQKYREEQGRKRWEKLGIQP